ncbi:serine hydrolase domain-containing protein [Marinobacter sp.]|uniref:serine hydrolase domain-containing protein n=1 Tax=Marinobacter sp. TaxID=50741 RepID=UPI0019C7DDB5|nr:serine hydrolase domain-containing protein [Marinobacter sp.]MBD3655337.1 beta-lactamase family protein [Marinobacter sp.]
MKKAISLLKVSVLFLIPLSFMVHFWITDHRGVMRFLYPAEAVVSHLGAECSYGSPDWLIDAAKAGIWSLKALSTQVAFVDEYGVLSHCESGWERSIFGKPVHADSKFRYGSLTKPVTSAAILSLETISDFDLSTDVSKYFLDANHEEDVDASEFASLDEVLRHVSGIQGEVFTIKEKPWCPYSMGERENYAFKKESKSKIKYSNLGFCILGAVVAREIGGDYRASVSKLFNLEERGISFLNGWDAPDFVTRDFRYNDFYGISVPARFDYYAISSTAGMAGSASSYARLIKDLLSEGYRDFVTEKVEGCDSREIRKCYGRAFYVYQTASGEVVNVKEGYLPGSSGVVIINDRNEVLVWLGNSDTDNAASGERMKEFIDEIVSTAF